MAASPEFLAFLQDQFAQFGSVDVRRMFGGTGLFRDGIMFGFVVGDTLYLKTDDGSRSAYEDAGMEPFRYERGGRTVSLGYHEVPADVLEDGELLAEWTARARIAAVAAKQRRSKTS